MGSIRRFTPVKLFVGVRASDGRLGSPIQDRLVASYGAIDHQSSVSAAGIDRVFFSFEGLIEADQFADIQKQTNEIVEETGYLENARVVLASTTDFYHKIYHFKHDTFQAVSESDSGSSVYQPFFLQIRQIYRSQLRTMCILNREETP